MQQVEAGEIDLGTVEHVVRPGVMPERAILPRRLNHNAVRGAHVHRAQTGGADAGRGQLVAGDRAESVRPDRRLHVDVDAEPGQGERRVSDAPSDRDGERADVEQSPRLARRLAVQAGREIDAHVPCHRDPTARVHTWRTPAASTSSTRSLPCAASAAS